MPKDYKKWHELKSHIEESIEAPLYRTQEVWWCSFGANVGVETDGTSGQFERPVLVFRKFNRDMFWGLPITSREKLNKSFYATLLIHKKEQTVILSQLRVLSAKRLVRRLAKISDPQFMVVEEAVSRLINETDPLRGPRVPNGNTSIVGESVRYVKP